MQVFFFFFWTGRPLCCVGVRLDFTLKLWFFISCGQKSQHIQRQNCIPGMTERICHSLKSSNIHDSFLEIRMKSVSGANNMMFLGMDSFFCFFFWQRICGYILRSHCSKHHQGAGGWTCLEWSWRSERTALCLAMSPTSWRGKRSAALCNSSWVWAQTLKRTASLWSNLLMWDFSPTTHKEVARKHECVSFQKITPRFAVFPLGKGFIVGFQEHYFSTLWPLCETWFRILSHCLGSWRSC